jgi:hypothetical protein
VTLEAGERSLEGWEPEIGADLPSGGSSTWPSTTGAPTVVKTDGTELSGYVFNRDAEAPEPFIQMFDASGAGPLRVLYSEIRTIRFTGRDPAAGNSYAAWIKRKELEKAERAAAGGAPRA